MALFFRCALLVLATALAATHARAESMTLSVQNDSEHVVQLKLFSRDRNEQWPSFSKAFGVKPAKDAQTLEIQCEKGENICYGAWLPQQRAAATWGAGQKGLTPCESCCFVCGDGKEVRKIVIDEPSSALASPKLKEAPLQGR
jgi:hypothetical protein